MRRARDILGVKADATAADITAAYRRRAMRLHPDRNPDDSARAKDDFQRLQTAYRQLLAAAEEEEREPDWDSLVAEAEPEPEAEEGDWREDFPIMSAAFVVCGVTAALSASDWRLALGLFALFLLLSLNYYRPPRFIVGIRMKKIFKLAIHLYLLALLAAGVLWLIIRLWAGFA